MRTTLNLNPASVCLNIKVIDSLVEMPLTYNLTVTKVTLKLLYLCFHVPLFLKYTGCVFVYLSGRVAKEVIEASSKIQREPPKVCRSGQVTTLTLTPCLCC